jgi:hypothetical protein
MHTVDLTTNSVIIDGYCSGLQMFTNLSIAMQTKIPDSIATNQWMANIWAKHSGTLMALALNHKMAKIRHDSGSQSHVHHNQDTQKMVHRLVQCCLSVDNGQD